MSCLPSPSHHHFCKWYVHTIPRKMGGCVYALFYPLKIPMKRVSLSRSSDSRIMEFNDHKDGYSTLNRLVGIIRTRTMG